MPGGLWTASLFGAHLLIIMTHQSFGFFHIGSRRGADLLLLFRPTWVLSSSIRCALFLGKALLSMHSGILPERPSASLVGLFRANVLSIPRARAAFAPSLLAGTQPLLVPADDVM